MIIINKYYNKLAYFHNGYIEVFDPVATGKTREKTPVGFFKVVNRIKNRPYYTSHIHDIRFDVMSHFFLPKYSFYSLFFRHFLYLFFFIM
ncbi:L,D-transpeptidase [Priestia megaterium]|uniref:L,D-transpeptidase n=1 Tax=Priestia megaterium TaxID=1404 RepID=UPI00359C7177